MSDAKIIPFRMDGRRAMIEEINAKMRPVKLKVSELDDPSSLDVEVIIAVHYSDVGAQGEGGCVEILYLSESEVRFLKGNYAYGGLDINAVYQKLPMLECLDCRKGMPYPFGGSLEIPDGWDYMYMGLSHHLFARIEVWQNVGAFILRIRRDQAFDAVAWVCGVECE